MHVHICVSLNVVRLRSDVYKCHISAVCGVCIHIQYTNESRGFM